MYNHHLFIVQATALCSSQQRRKKSFIKLLLDHDQQERRPGVDVIKPSSSSQRLASNKLVRFSKASRLSLTLSSMLEAGLVNQS
jgi:hypothetical protein